MIVGLYTDAHFSLNSSILLGAKNSLEGRLSYLIKSFEWMYKEFESRGVSMIFDLGDLADSCNLRAEEITAISKALSFNTTIPEYHILGNHERLDETGTINSINFVHNFKNHHVITDITKIDKFTLIPYNKYEDRDFDDYKSEYALTHIDILGSDIGGWSLKSGLSPDYMMKQFGLVINGHIHNGSWVIPKRILNLGAISGQNFSSKSIHWNPSIVILDTDTGKLEFIENPHALRFVNINCNEISDVINIIDKFNKQSSYAVQVKVPMSIVEDVRTLIDKSKCILTSRILTKVTESELGGLTFEEIDKVNSLDGGFSHLVNYINEQENLPYPKDDILKVIKELEEFDNASNI